ncbi:hypothetical protein CEXT_755641 [Caerostris extrusa]|uniref:Uncharacterized protein n=1 Tax=Caerostris extrusa TaxID=172846 RepID=A0AAV4QHP6_CAEEX|nr:hypothetical protein CEXT_755641 [Caerostris extrusa]
MEFDGHICRIDPSSLTFRMFNYIPFGIRTRGRPKLRWTECVDEDLKVLRVGKNFRIVEIGMEEGSREGLAHHGLSNQ